MVHILDGIVSFSTSSPTSIPSPNFFPYTYGLAIILSLRPRFPYLCLFFLVFFILRVYGLRVFLWALTLMLYTAPRNLTRLCFRIILTSTLSLKHHPITLRPF